VRWRLTAAVAVLLAAGLLGAGLLSGRGIPRHTTTTMPITTTPPPKQDTSLPWPTYGADNNRTRAVTAPGLRPPFRKLWTYHGHHLLELPPVAGYGLLYEESFDGRIHAIDPKTGKVEWQYYARRCGWSSPALGQGLVFATFIGDVSSPCWKLGGGSIVALNARTGKIRWQRNVGQTESSPLLAHGTVYFGSTNGYVYAFDAATGKERWSFNTGGAVKGSPALANGRLFIGNYGGTFYGLDAGTGQEIWHNGGHGNFYAGASVVDGRVYVGSIDGRVYCFSAANGAQLWSFGTGGYVYASTAVWRGIVLVGSYDTNFYAINSTTGSERWSFDAGGNISGSASVIDGIVYFSTLSPHRTYAVDVASGHLVEKWNDGDYSPAVAAGGRLFLVGLGRIYALEPR
jgi:outer membrane protein assembly factor BamB